MKKYYLFAALATAGLFAGCSSDETLSIADDAPQYAPVNDNEKAAIKLQIGDITRGTGTVGSLESDEANNKWGGAKVQAHDAQQGRTHLCC